MKDSWIDKNELDDLVSGISPHKRPEVPSTEDLFDDIPSINIPRSQPNQQQQRPPLHLQQQTYHHPIQSPPQSVITPVSQPAAQPPVQPAVQPAQEATGESPLQVLVSRTGGQERREKVSSPFSIDEDDDFEDVEAQIEQLTAETARAIQALADARERADKNGLIAATKVETEEIQVVETLKEPDMKDEIEEAPEVGEVEAEAEIDEPDEEILEVQQPLDRIPLDVEIDTHFSLKGRLSQLASILGEYVGMEEMIVVDRDGFSLFSTKESLTVEKSVGQFVKSIRKVYDSEVEARSYTASQLAVEDGKWLCIMPSDGEIEGQFLLKALLTTPLDRPEIYVLVELLNEVLRPENSEPA